MNHVNTPGLSRKIGKAAVFFLTGSRSGYFQDMAVVSGYMVSHKVETSLSSRWRLLPPRGGDFSFLEVETSLSSSWRLLPPRGGDFSFLEVETSPSSRWRLLPPRGGDFFLEVETSSSDIPSRRGHSVRPLSVCPCCSLQWWRRQNFCTSPRRSLQSEEQWPLGFRRRNAKPRAHRFNTGCLC